MIVFLFDGAASIFGLSAVSERLSTADLIGIIVFLEFTAALEFAVLSELAVLFEFFGLFTFPVLFESVDLFESRAVAAVLTTDFDLALTGVLATGGAAFVFFGVGFFAGAELLFGFAFGEPKSVLLLPKS
jgi:hypothetical protein